jgi:hypothetical protein
MSEIIYLKKILSEKSVENKGKKNSKRSKLKPFKQGKILTASLIKKKDCFSKKT